MYDNPTPEEGQEIEGTITVTYSFSTSFPKKWTVEQMKEYIECNIYDFIDEIEHVKIDV